MDVYVFKRLAAFGGVDFDRAQQLAVKRTLQRFRRMLDIRNLGTGVSTVGKREDVQVRAKDPRYPEGKYNYGFDEVREGDVRDDSFDGFVGRTLRYALRHEHDRARRSLDQLGGNATQLALFCRSNSMCPEYDEALLLQRRKFENRRRRERAPSNQVADGDGRFAVGRSLKVRLGLGKSLCDAADRFIGLLGGACRIDLNEASRADGRHDVKYIERYAEGDG